MFLISEAGTLLTLGKKKQKLQLLAFTKDLPPISLSYTLETLEEIMANYQ